MKNPPCVGVLALQGDFSKHVAVLKKLGADVVEVRTPEELARCDGLILPGGESTSILRQMQFVALDKAIKDFAVTRPLFGTCAGLILMSSRIKNDAMQPMNIINIEVERNAFGRQNDSFKARLPIYLEDAQSTDCEAMFIRAPRIVSCGKEVKILASYQEEPVLVQQGIHLAATFHPELTDNNVIHHYFINSF